MIAPWNVWPSPARSLAISAVRLMLVALLGLAVSVDRAAAGPPAAPVQAEIEALLARLESSGCEFNRNGTWYPGGEAKAHLMVKLKYLEDHGTVGSAEQFIELAASSSSISGKPYLVRCAGTPAVPSGPWLKAQLPAIRATLQTRPGRT